MYYTTYQYSDKAGKNVGVVMRAGTDGTEPVTVVAGIGDPQAITINFTTLRLFWADSKSDRIESSDFQGGDRRTVVRSRTRNDTDQVDIQPWIQLNSFSLKQDVLI